MNRDSVTLISGRSHPELAAQVAKYLGVELGSVELGTFPDGEISVELLESVRDRDVFVLQSLALTPQSHLIELLILIDALKRASARTIVPVIPYYAYARQDRRHLSRVPITAKLVADLLDQAGASHVVTMDLHAEQIEGFFGIPVDNLYARPVLIKAFGELRGEWVIGCPDIGSVKIARDFADRLGLEMAIVDKRRLGPDQVAVSAVLGSVSGKNVLLTDDMCSTGSTLVEAAKLCIEHGAERVFASVTHGLFVGDALDRIADSPIERVWTTDTVPGIKEHEKIEVVSSAPLFGEAVKRMSERESLSELFQ